MLYRVKDLPEEYAELFFREGGKTRFKCSACGNKISISSPKDIFLAIEKNGSWDSRCAFCKGIRVWSQEEIDSWPEGAKRCSGKCNLVKPLEEFHVSKGELLGRNKLCKSCRLPNAKKNYRNRAKAPERLLIDGARCRAKKKGLPFDIDENDIEIPEYCPVLGIRLARRNVFSAPTLDRIIPSLGYVRGNVVVISGKANMIKSSASHEEILKVANWLRSMVEANTPDGAGCEQVDLV